jgi:copper homeostasis protein
MTRPVTRPLLEVAVSSAPGAAVAESAGADRLELSCALTLGGLTPSLGLLREVRRATRLPLMVLIRPRPGGFCYSEAELLFMERDSAIALDNGADGIVIGALTADRQVAPELGQLVKHVPPREIVFHRAFDEVADPFVALEHLIVLGVRRVLTSGQRPTAIEGAALLSRLIEQSAGRIEVLPGAGVRSSNVAELVRLTGCTQAHGTFRAPGDEERTDGDEVRRVVEELRKLAPCGEREKASGEA